MDSRVKAVATRTMYDMSRMIAKGYNDSVDANARAAMKQQFAQDRWQAAQQDYAVPSNNVLLSVEQLPADAPQFIREYAEFYKTKRGFHPRSINSNGAWTNTTPPALMNMPLLAYSSELRTPVLIVAGENAHSRYFSEDAFKAIGSPKNCLFCQMRCIRIYTITAQAKSPLIALNNFLKRI